MVDSAHSHTFLALTWCCRARVLAPLLRITSWPAVASLSSAADSTIPDSWGLMLPERG